MPAPTSPMGGLMLGLGSGRRKYEECQAGQLKAAQDAASFGLKLGTEQRLTTAAGEKQAANIMARIAAPDYTPSEAPYLVSAAKDWDGAYGKLFPNTELTKRVTQMLNLDPQAPSRPSRAASGFESTPRAASDSHFMPSRSSEIAGWADPVKKILYDTKLSSAAKDLKFQLQGGQMLQGGLDYLRERTGGALGHPMAPVAILEYGAHVMATAGMPPDEVIKIMDQLNEQVGDARAAMATEHGRLDQFERQVGQVTKDATKMIGELLGGEYDGMGNMIRSVTEGYGTLHKQMIRSAARMGGAGESLPVIVLALGDMYADENGNFPFPPLINSATGETGMITPYHKNLLSSPAWFTTEVQRFYGAGNHPEAWEPVWDAGNKTGALYNSATGAFEPISQPPSSPTPIPGSAKPRPALPGENTRPLQGEHTGAEPTKGTQLSQAELDFAASIPGQLPKWLMDVVSEGRRQTGFDKGTKQGYQAADRVRAWLKDYLARPAGNK